MYDRCITRGVVGSILPVLYGNGFRLMQTPEAVIISYGMIHDTRTIWLDGRPHLGAKVRQLLGDSRGRFDGNTLVVDTTNFTDRTSIGANGNGTRHSDRMTITERFTRIDPQMIDYQITVNDPVTYTQPFTLRLTITSQPNYQLYVSSLPRGKRCREVCVERRPDVARPGGRRGHRERAAVPGRDMASPSRSAGSRDARARRVRGTVRSRT